MEDKILTEELGKAVCDRLGLPLQTTLREWKADTSGSGDVVVSMTTVKVLTREEWNDLQEVAAKRAMDRHAAEAQK